MYRPADLSPRATADASVSSRKRCSECWRRSGRNERVMSAVGRDVRSSRPPTHTCFPSFLVLVTVLCGGTEARCGGSVDVLALLTVKGRGETVFFSATTASARSLSRADESFTSKYHTRHRSVSTILKSVLLYRHDCVVSISGPSYSASFFTWRQGFNFVSVVSAPAILQRVSVTTVTADTLKHIFLLLELFGCKVTCH